ncbi:hypothetical protein ISF_09813 [Cordyceps fumosorosea ARSEF 2679]|uniref:DUF6604 domain-containing protein n=1 Tax=Cordyceps fumosorosea (strain ARSEF 2679) TaxID=1081104 RepID=A0A167BSM4_CORFA|nr:hypothetical protein ISF_09813 [Cordyceps fumosorosea ARSEF 2679]OAA40372.1 hypothetical protein ISF_09813 [Cordyceps fumosorosea ARSEF 2679]
MPPSSLKGIYRNYKADTDVVASWLATTAQQHGYRVGGASAAYPAATGGRLKGKARKQAKATMPVATLGMTAENKTKYIIKVRDFEALAVYIAGLGSTVLVPSFFTNALRRVISVRKSFAERLGSAGVKITVASEVTHSFFVEQLEKVWQILSPAAHATTATINATVTGQDDRDERSNRRARSSATNDTIVSNIFSALRVYHPSNRLEDDSDAIRPAPVRTTFVAEQGDSVLDMIFALTTLLNDYADIRAEIRALWTEHASGRLDLAAASVATNAAIEMARSMEDEMKALFDKSDGVHIVTEAYFHSLCEASGIDKLDKEMSHDPYNLAAYDIADVCLINMLTLLASYTASVDRQETCLQTYSGKFGWYDEALGGKAQTKRQQWTQDMTAVLELMPDLSFLVLKLGRLSVVDELTRGLAYVMDDGKRRAKLWLAFALQIYVDILRDFVPDCDSLGEMQAEVREIKHAMLTVPASDPHRVTVMRAAGLWDTDPIWAARGMAVSAELLPQAHTAPFKFLRRNPMYCGLLVHHMRSTRQTEGLSYAATPGALLGVVQLYHALRNERLLPEHCTWDDLQELWTLQGDASFFVGDPPTTKEAYFSNYALSIGTSVTHWAAASSRRKGKGKQPTFKVHSDNRRNLMPIGYLSLAVNHRIKHPGARVPWSPEAVQDTLVEGVSRRHTDSRSRLQRGGKDGVGVARARIASLPPAGLVREVAEAVQHEKRGLCFDFFIMHNQSWSFLTVLREALWAVVPAIAQGGSDAETLPFVPGICFAAAAGKSLNQAVVVTANDALLRTAADVMRTFVRDGGGSVVRMDVEREVSLEEVESLCGQEGDPWRLKRLEFGDGVGGGLNSVTRS